MIFSPTALTGLPKDVAEAELDLNFERLQDQLVYVQAVVTTLVDATDGAVLVYLPDGTIARDKAYYWQKDDASANAVTITAYGTQTIVGSATKVLAAQYDRAYLIWSPATQEWVIL